MFFVVKIIISALIIAIVSEISKKYTSVGGLIAAMPLTTLLSMFWLYFENKDNELILNFLLSVIQGVFITFLFFIPCIFLLKKGCNFYTSVFLSLMLLAISAYLQQKYILQSF